MQKNVLSYNIRAGDTSTTTTEMMHSPEATGVASKMIGSQCVSSGRAFWQPQFQVT